MVFSQLTILNHLFFHISWHEFQIFLVNHETLYLMALSNNRERKWISLRVGHAEKPFAYPLHFTFYGDVDGLERIRNKTILLDCSELVFQADVTILLLQKLVMVLKSGLFMGLLHFLDLLEPLCSGWIVFNFKLSEELLVVLGFFYQGCCSRFDHIHVLFISSFCNDMLAFIENFFRNHIKEFCFLTCSPVLKPVKLPEKLRFLKIFSGVSNDMYALFNFLYWYLQHTCTYSLCKHKTRSVSFTSDQFVVAKCLIWLELLKFSIAILFFWEIWNKFQRFFVYILLAIEFYFLLHLVNFFPSLFSYSLFDCFEDGITIDNINSSSYD